MMQGEMNGSGKHDSKKRKEAENREKENPMKPGENPEKHSAKPPISPSGL